MIGGHYGLSSESSCRSSWSSKPGTCRSCRTSIPIILSFVFYNHAAPTALSQGPSGRHDCSMAERTLISSPIGAAWGRGPVQASRIGSPLRAGCPNRVERSPLQPSFYTSGKRRVAMKQSQRHRLLGPARTRSTSRGKRNNRSRRQRVDRSNRRERLCSEGETSPLKTPYYSLS